MFVLVRDDLSDIQKAVQAGHALAEYLLKQNRLPRLWNNGTLVYLRVKDESALKLWMGKLTFREIKFEVFREPDLDNSITALACVAKDKVFKGVKLLGCGPI